MIEKIPFDLSGFANSVVRKIWLLQRSYNWQLVLPHNINGIIGIFVSQYCQDVKFGDYSMNTLSMLRYGPQQRFYAGLEEIDSASLHFVCPVDNSVLDYFYGWRELVIDKNGYYYPKNNYKKTIYVGTYDRSGIQSINFEFQGCFPKTKPKFDLSYKSDGFLEVDIGLSVDRINTKSVIGGVQKAIVGAVGEVVKGAVSAVQAGIGKLEF